ncbi:ParB N-terminal domain-containing protein [Streptomyces sp. NBC_01433]|uniref:ParB/RepB/Spo0J family partition protein n=1 Tax=Streptomyces sp. NBC_01433 TaxID=2903864 RepID=UPI0022537338|nr:ParB N-terminal domain-containing protein [Streptomyces sp. NBC_01433]MCX4682305.1 ParB N-terminal domain-containing protein [Streptomyces sp. NBC_01433]
MSIAVEESLAPTRATAGLAKALESSEQLRQRRFELLPMRGSVYTDVQGRGPGPSTSPEGLADLITSISAVGVLHPVLVEELPGPEGRVQRRLVIGERRYRACRWGAVNQPDNPRFEKLPAVICPGPISDEDRRTWQLVENLAREDLQPGELANALLLERSAILRTQLDNAGIEVSEDIQRLEDPVARFEALEKLRGSDANLAAPWNLVLRRLGLQITSRRAREVVAAFRTLPRELSADMDQHQVALAARTNLARLSRGRREAASELWQAVKRLGRTDLLSAATRAQATNPEMPAEIAVSTAVTAHEQANAERAATLSRSTAQREESGSEDFAESADGEAQESAVSGNEEAASPSGHAGPTGPQSSSLGLAASDGEQSLPADEWDETPEPVDPPVLAAALEGLRGLNAQLAEGRSLHRFDAGSLRMLLTDLQRHTSAGTERTVA